MFGKRPPSQRTPHPDPARELELQRILDLRDSIARRAGLVKQYQGEIGKLYYAIRMESNVKRIESYRDEVRMLHDRITGAEEQIAQAGEQIAALQEKISPDDLAYLWS